MKKTKEKQIKSEVKNIDSFNIDISDEMMSEIQKIKPRAKNYFLLRNAVFLIIIFALSLLASYSLGALIVDTKKNITLSQLGLASNYWINQFIYEFVISMLLCGLIIYLVLKQTDWKIAYSKTYFILFIVIIFASGTYITTQALNEEDFEVVSKPLSRIEFRKRISDEVFKEKLDAGIVAGIVVKISQEKDFYIITVKNPRASYDLIYLKNTKESKDLKKLEKIPKIGNYASFKVEKKNEKLYIKNIMKERPDLRRIGVRIPPSRILRP